MQHNNSGFTLVEIMVVIVIFSVLAGVIGVSAGKSDTQKNRAYYEHLQSSLRYIRLISAERMQPMGIRMVTDDDGQETIEVVKLDNAYSSYQQANAMTDNAKNSMELSANIRSDSQQDDSKKTPTWTLDDDIELPELPNNLQISIDSAELADDNRTQDDLQPWFQGQEVPQIVWFGTGQSTPASIKLSYNDRAVGDVIKIMPDGGLQIGNVTNQ